MLSVNLQNSVNKLKKAAAAAKKVGGNIVKGEKKKIAFAKKVVKKVKAAKIGEKIKDKVDDAIKLAKKVGSPWLLLIPVAPQMRAALRLNGITPPKDLEKLGRTFYDNIVKVNTLESQVANDRHGFAHFAETNHVNHIAPIAIEAIISAILSLISGIKKKKEQGMELNKTEKVIDNVSESAETMAEEAAANEVEETIGETIVKYLPWIVGAIVAIILLKKLKIF